ncbi:hypothetical protein SAMN02745245_00982 [Anaerosphaera aminiphila DSM 21120]|uniref:Uncharacterized protein n=1 Tax=Anaerosphaera aminiphila DSM 21120 TaxID=1120995 RepID=A0A1M5RP62_9FIRM|nr:hypothetical protein [Anaerosphaera aminiphila]SHH28022.1 hypothetical protein SAMN02745245_00982 [Anaerosphaera aminiphila DSM 21120]
MSNYEEKEAKTLNEIADTLIKLDKTFEDLEESEGRVKHFIEQEKAIHEIKKIVKKCNKIEDLEDDHIYDEVLNLEDLKDFESENLKEIGNTIIDLDKTLEKLDEGKNSKVKSYIEQKKAIHQVKKILHNVGLFDSYVEDELDNM